MNRPDQDRFKLQMLRILATDRFLEIRCQGIRAEQERCRDQAKKKKVAQTELAAMKIVQLESTESLKKAEARFKSMHQQYKGNLDEMQDEKLALRVALEDERAATADLQHLIKSKAATVAQLNSRLTATAGGKTLEASIAELRERLATAEAVGRASNEEWAKERQQLNSKEMSFGPEPATRQLTRPLTGLERKPRSTRSGCFENLGILRIPGEAERRRTHPAPSNACPADPW